MKELVWTPFRSLLRREVGRFMKVAAQTIVTPMVSAGLYLMIFGVSLGQQITLSDGLPYMAFLIPGLIMMGCLNNAFQNTSSTIISAKFGGDLEDLKASPITNSQILGALSVAAVARGMIVAVIIALVGEGAYYLSFGEWLPISHGLVLVTFLVLGGLTFANIGVSVGFWARTFDQLSAVGSFVLLPLIYLGGVFFSINQLPEFWRKVAALNPLLYMINGVRYGLLGHSDVDWRLALGVTALAFCLTSVLAILSLRRGSFHRW